MQCCIYHTILVEQVPLNEWESDEEDIVHLVLFFDQFRTARSMTEGLLSVWGIGYLEQIAAALALCLILTHRHSRIWGFKGSCVSDHKIYDTFVPQIYRTGCARVPISYNPKNIQWKAGKLTDSCRQLVCRRLDCRRDGLSPRWPHTISTVLV